jgi:outer membrane protein assembly factor BamD (BamD/ComL family)
MKIYSLLFILLLGLSSCSKSPEVLYNEAKTAEEQKNYQAALWKYQEVVEKHHESALAESSQFRIVMIYSEAMKDFEKAAEGYLKLYELFPNSPNAPRALFLAGFLYSNELKQFDKAKEKYELFLQKFPNHDLAQSAKFELETMGKDPLEYLKQKNVLAEDTVQTKPQKMKQTAK